MLSQNTAWHAQARECGKCLDSRLDQPYNKVFLLRVILNESHSISGSHRKGDPVQATVTLTGGPAVTTPACVSLFYPYAVQATQTRAASTSQHGHHVGPEPACNSHQEAGDTPYREQIQNKMNLSPVTSTPQFLGGSTVRKQAQTYFWPARTIGSAAK